LPRFAISWRRSGSDGLPEGGDLTWLSQIPRWLVLLAGAAALIVLLAWLLQRKFIYIPYPASVPAADSLLPGGVEVTLVTEDRLPLGAWFVPAAGGGKGPAVLVFNGNAGNRSMRSDLASELSAAGLSVLLFDYRGYGGNPGYPSEKGLLRDARTARAWLETREDVDPERIVYFGESLGGGVAVALAAERPPAALVLRSPWTSLVDVARRHYWFLPVGTLLKDRYPSIRRIGNISSPLLVVAGEHDSIVPAQQSRDLYEAAREPKRLVVIPGADHNDYSLLAGETLIEETLLFLEEHLDWKRVED
jgi:fermentation-respiration switch protein FrsA (DUF1100 family)